MLQYVGLKYGHEPLQVHVPENFEGLRSSEDDELYVEVQMKAFTLDELALIQSAIDSLSYPQALVKGAVIVDEDDPLISADHQFLDALELREGLRNSRMCSGGGERSIYERVLIIRESGFAGNGNAELPEAV
jgi:hypothetical protein